MVWEQGIAIIAMVTAEEVSPPVSEWIVSASNEKLTVSGPDLEKKVGWGCRSELQTLSLRARPSRGGASCSDRPRACLTGGRQGEELQVLAATRLQAQHRHLRKV